MNMRHSSAPRRGFLGEPGPTWLGWWVKWAVIFFWPLMFGLVAVEVVWLVLAGLVAALAVTGRRRARRKV
jgi:hypothetical protein